MCRLFGFRSAIPSAVHRSLLEADNALGTQSDRHPDGWGVAYYVHGAPHVIRSADKAQTDQLFQRVSGIVSSETVVAHVRKATAGETSVLNSHPFQYGPWIFAHNGEIPRFERYRSLLRRRVPERLRGFVLGETDSEVIFMLFVAALEAQGRGHRAGAVRAALAAVERTIEEVCSDIGPDQLLLNFMVTDGQTLVAYRRGKELYWSSYKSRCPERDRCSSFDQSCEHASATGIVNHLVISSEPIGTENVWHPMENGQAISVDGDMRLEMGSLRALPVLVSPAFASHPVAS